MNDLTAEERKLIATRRTEAAHAALHAQRAADRVKQYAEALATVERLEREDPDVERRYYRAHKICTCGQQNTDRECTACFDAKGRFIGR